MVSYTLCVGDPLKLYTHIKRGQFCGGYRWRAKETIKGSFFYIFVYTVQDMQKIISIKKLSFSFGERALFTDISFKCDDRDRLCILGENGTGKSTLLKIIAGEEQEAGTIEGGLIEKNSHIRFVYVPQEFEKASLELSVKDYVEQKAGVAFTKKVHTRASDLGFNLSKYEQALCGSLSGGQQKILALSVAFALNPDFILLDEPENHIDIVSRVVLIEMLQEYRGGLIFISHDRLIINAVANKVAELARGEIHISEGGYDEYVEEKMMRLGGLQRSYDAETKRIKQLQSSISILAQKAFRGKEISAYRAKKAELEQLKQSHKTNSRPDDKKTRIKIGSQESELHGGKLLCRVKKGTFKYPTSGLGVKSSGKADKGIDIFRDVDLEVRFGTHIVLLGRNGSGKSTFLKCLVEEEKLTSGDVEWVDGVKRAYFDQHAQFDPEATAVDVVMKKLNCFEVEARAALGAMRFNAEKMTTKTKSLSGGERMRLRFAIVFGHKPDFIILDEPTNHLDEVTWEILLFACKSASSTILLVSHDYEFIQEFLTDKDGEMKGMFWVIKDQAVVPRYKDLNDLLEEMEK